MSIKKTLQEFISKAIVIHGDKYSYEYIKEYINISTKVPIFCYEHGLWEQTPHGHLRGKGCLKCSRKSTRDSASFINDARLVHGDKYDYSKVKYINNHSKVVIICSKHGKFQQTPNGHLSGHGCYKCYLDAKTRTTEWFIKKASEIHNNKYLYSKVEYFDSRDKIIIICIKHGEFQQLPSCHLSGCGCPKCSTSISKKETQWLNKIGLPDDKEHRQVRIKLKDKAVIVDGYDPQTNTVYEFHGDMWHGNLRLYNPEDINPVNKKTYGELFMKTSGRSRLIKEAGYDIVSIWESEWDEQQKGEEGQHNEGERCEG